MAQELNINPAMTVTIEGVRQSGKSCLAFNMLKVLGNAGYDARILSDDHKLVTLEVKVRTWKQARKGKTCK
jgi:predicted AAA+ superfamily ATPase